MSASRKKHLSGRAVGKWLWGAAGVGVLAAFLYFLTTLGPRSVSDAGRVSTAVNDPSMVRLSGEIDELEKHYRRLAEGEMSRAEATAVLVKAVEKQRELLRTFTQAGLDQSARLSRLETELDNVKAAEKVVLAGRLQREGEEALTAGKLDEAGARLREALQLQREINLSSAGSRYKDYVRETALTQAVASVEAAPLKREVETAMAAARKASEQERWAEALAGYTAARTTQDRINREYGRTRYADLAGVDRLNAEIESINAAGIAAQVDLREKSGDEAVAGGIHPQAASLFEQAEALQLQINKEYPRSRFVSSQRIEKLEVKRQSSLSTEAADTVARLDREIGGHLRLRQVAAAESKITEAGSLQERLFKDYPKSDRLNGELRIKLAYLLTLRRELRSLQEEVYKHLVVLPGARQRLLFNTEVPQALYLLVMTINPSRNAGPALPVDSVSWSDAQAFCTRLSWLLGANVRLPTVDEYRLALGRDTGGVWSGRNSEGRSRETGSLAMNTTGFFDLVGNLAEWADAAGDADRAPVFGGSYLDEVETLRQVPVEPRLKGDRSRHVGMRVLVELQAG